MSSANYKKTKKIELDVTKKLFKYIYTNINLSNVIEELDREYSYFYDTENNIAFNIWLSLDYIHKDGKTFTEKFLEENSKDLSKKERTILEERKDSYVSLFKIIKYEEERVYVKDIFTEKHFYLIEPEISNIIKEGEYVFSRIAKGLNDYSFIGDINYLPSSIKYDFIKKVLYDFNLTRTEIKGLAMKNYLKRFALNLYKIYDDIIFNLLDNEEGLDFYELDGLEGFEEFESYLSTKMDENNVDQQISNLSNIVEFYLASEDMDAKELKDLNLDDFFTSAIEEGLIAVKSELLSYIKTLKLYFNFLSKKSKDYEFIYLELLSINKNPFKYVKQLNSYDANFIMDRNFSYYIKDVLNHRALDFIRDFDLFLLYIEANNMDLTLKNKKIKRADLFQINESLENKDTIESKAPNQKNFSTIDLFYNIALDLEILEIEDRKIFFNKRSMDYLLLDDNEKYIILFNNILEKLTRDEERDTKMTLLSRISKMNMLTKYSSSLFLVGKKDFFKSCGSSLKMLGLINYDNDRKNEITITSLGKRASTYLDKIINTNKNNLIVLKDFIK